jgi:hypothetical protein
MGPAILAMVQIIENWTCITGVVLACGQPAGEATAPPDAQKVVLEIAIEKTAEVKGFKSLIAKQAGERIEIMLPQSLAEQAGDLKGRKVTIPVRMARQGRYFAAPDWNLKTGSERCGPNPPQDGE